MSDTGATSETRAASAPARRRALSIALWALWGRLGPLAADQYRVNE
jgi:hypothetical protein